MLHNICISAVAIPLRSVSHGPWASCLGTHHPNVYNFSEAKVHGGLCGLMNVQVEGQGLMSQLGREHFQTVSTLAHLLLPQYASGAW